MTDATLWSADGETVAFEVRGIYPAPAVTVWAGGELDPCYLTPADARRAADEWPAILRRLADEAEARAADLEAMPRCEHGWTGPHPVYSLDPPHVMRRCRGPRPEDGCAECTEAGTRNCVAGCRPATGEAP